MKIGIMDSGVGGLTTLSRCVDVCGGDYIYLKDEKGPYGDKDDGFVIQRALRACEKLIDLGAQTIIIACNTATNVAISIVRKAFADVRFIGVEPAVKPALTECERIAVALTPVAARQDKFKQLISDSLLRIKLVTPAFLAPAIEKSYFDYTQKNILADKLLQEIGDVDGLVLGCTHYVYLKHALKRKRTDLKVFDGNDGVAKRLLSLNGKSQFSNVEFVNMN
ncbi:MAG: aspartate/glutamate racemase family protein [Clostridia bacterium]|nr:aspartate/glutamate racemase family protein [Clostridia bacterium]